ncbi:outer membrane beta-barrel protein [Bdellovibrio sp. HCB337]|uniref:outer membrane beta-barrel protein n=1 Tax=Bdellovibrio sp. HCB337 TaxID=3394358 RepID=UPI0039A52A31
MTKYFVSTFVLLTSISLMAAPKARKATTPAAAPEVSVREEALKENAHLDQKAYKKAIQASEAQQANVSSFLKLQDPTPELRNRPWLWTFAFKMQNMQPMGTGSVSNLTFDLESYGPSMMPSFEFGFLVNAIDAKYVSWSTGLSAHAGYMSQSTDLVTPGGFKYEDTRLTTTLVSAVWSHRFKPTKTPKFSVLINPEYGFVNYTQTNVESTLANFSQQNNYWGLGLGAEYSFTRKWAVLAQYAYRDASEKAAVSSGLQKDNFEIGTQVTW